jgi:hypothetical protein
MHLILKRVSLRLADEHHQHVVELTYRWQLLRLADRHYDIISLINGAQSRTCRTSSISSGATFFW